MLENIPSAGHAPGLPAVTRRTLLRASPVLLAPALLTDMAQAAPTDAPDPLPALVAAYLNTCEAFNVEDHEPTADALFADMDRLGNQIEGTIATTSAGLIAQITYLQESYGGSAPRGGEGVEHIDVPSPLLDLLKAGLGRL